MSIRINPEALKQIIECARRDYPNETCGLLIGSGNEIGRVFPAQNLRAGEREDRYLINPKGQLEADKLASSLGLDVIGCYHSHPDWPAKPSKTDLEDSWPHYIYIIVSVNKGVPGDVNAWKLDESEKEFAQLELVKP